MAERWEIVCLFFRGSNIKKLQCDFGWRQLCWQNFFYEKSSDWGVSFGCSHVRRWALQTTLANCQNVQYDVTQSVFCRTWYMHVHHGGGQKTCCAAVVGYCRSRKVSFLFPPMLFWHLYKWSWLYKKQSLENKNEFVFNCFPLMTLISMSIHPSTI